MNKIFYILVLFAALVGHSTASTNIDQMLDSMIESEGNDYLDARKNVLAIGHGALPLLGKVALESQSDWRRRLAARICYERILKEEEIVAFIDQDWERVVYDAIPEFQPDPAKLNEKGEVKEGVVSFQPGAKVIPMTGAQGFIYEDFLAECESLGAWYYFIELNWKDTGEVSKQTRYRRFNDLWPRWCGNVVRNQPEKIWINRVLSAHIKTCEFSGQTAYKNMDKYKTLVNDREPESIPILLSRFDELVALETRSLPKDHPVYQKILRINFKNILVFADTRHVEGLENIINRHSSLETYRAELEKVQKRLAPSEPDPRETFRIGLEPVVIPK